MPSQLRYLTAAQSQSQTSAIVEPLRTLYRTRHPYPENIFWLIEYANTSLSKDLDVKQKAYAGSIQSSRSILASPNGQAPLGHRSSPLPQPPQLAARAHERASIFWLLGKLRLYG